MQYGFKKENTKSMKNGIKYALWFIVIMVFFRACNACVGCTENAGQTIEKIDHWQQEQQKRENESQVREREAQRQREANKQINLSSVGRAIDLGLPSGTLWAEWNLGATKPEGYGEYFAWGETTGTNDGKRRYVWNTYKWCNGAHDLLTKYCNADSKYILESIDDAATVNWGNGWQIPSSNQLEELRQNCTWELVTRDGVNGYIAKSKINSNSIFLPLSGYCGTNDNIIVNRDNELLSIPTGYYWARNLEVGFWTGIGDPYSLIIDREETCISNSRVERCEGISIRPVYIQIVDEKGINEEEEEGEDINPNEPLPEELGTNQDEEYEEIIKAMELIVQ